MEELEKFEYIKNLLDSLDFKPCLYEQEKNLFYADDYSKEDRTFICLYVFAYRLKHNIINKDYNINYYWGYKDKDGLHMDIQNTLKAFNLHPIKFLYLCWFIKDLVETFTVNTEKICYPWDELEDLSHYLKSAESIVINGKYGKYKIDSKATLDLLNKVIGDYLEKEPLGKVVRSPKATNQTLDNIYRLYIFNKYLSKFLQDKKADKTIQASRDKSVLISRMIYILGLGTHIGKDGKEDYWEEYKDIKDKRTFKDKRNFLKGQLSKCKDMEINTINKEYLMYSLPQ